MKKIRLTCIVDDDSIYTFGLTRLIGRAKFSERLIMFSNGKLAMNFFNTNVDDVEQLPDVVLLDVNMPVMDGWEFLEEFIEMKPRFGKKILVYIISSSIAEEDFEKAKALSVVSDFIIKPVTEEQLLKILEEINILLEYETE